MNYKEHDFPRFKYHCNLLRKILDHDQERNNPEQLNSTLSTILVFGRITESILALLHPLTLDEDAEIGDFVLNLANQKVKVSFFIPFSPLSDAFVTPSNVIVIQIYITWTQLTLGEPQ